MHEIKMTLEKAAAKAGGDRYVGAVESETVTFYIPQAITRTSGKPAPTVTVTIKAD